MYSFSRHIKTVLASLAITASAILTLNSCDAVYEDLSPCPEGAELRFVYDYNMEFANAFMSQVSCLTVLVYDAQGKYVTTVTETSSVLEDEAWRMKIDLPAGSYKFIAYGGLACSESTFEFTPQPGADVAMTGVKLQLKSGLLTEPVSKNLHHLFYGALDLEIEENTPTYTGGTVEMMKDTNILRILLHNADGSDVDVNDFRFKITDTNTLFDHNNLLLPSPKVTYWPCHTANMGGAAKNSDADDKMPSFAVAEFSTSRFVTSSEANLTIEQISTGRKVLSIPLVKYLLLYKSASEQLYANMSSQEFLDRKSVWEMSLFLDPSPWGSVSIYIEDWRVRINDINEF